jgi:hypothetical protein
MPSIWQVLATPQGMYFVLTFGAIIFAMEWIVVGAICALCVQSFLRIDPPLTRLLVGIFSGPLALRRSYWLKAD